ncbi:hypothetical protein XENOCAPTIV_017897 [Xenoophorus captivus]|uniref:Uncharacterized protein n=1 Tax=Xenoophorus captivus TaxID=1517983 RepID=A0ABV0S7J4_9TELE
MARAALSRNRGLPGVRPTEGLLLIVTLLGLVCAANSLIDTKYLNIIQEYYEGGLEDAADKKKEFENRIKLSSIIFEEKLEGLHPTLKQLKEATSNSSSLKGFSKAVTDLLVKTRKNYAETLKAHQKEIDDIWSFIKAQEYGED